MRESIGMTWIFSLVITFTLIFAAFLSLALTYSKAYKLKNEVVTIIEKYEGLTTDVKCAKNDKACRDGMNAINRYGSINIINTFLKNSGYTAKGICPEDSYGFDTDKNNIPKNKASRKTKYSYCISYERSESRKKCSYRFNVTVFYDFNLPVLGQIRKYSISGHTNEIHHPVVNLPKEKNPYLCD